MSGNLNYNLFFDFYETFKHKGFKDLDPNHPFLSDIEAKLETTGQFFHIADMIHLEILFCSEGFHKFFGLEKDQLDPGVYLCQTHPDDFRRHSLGRSKVFKMASDMYLDKIDKWFISTHFKTKNAKGEYKDLLYQLCLFYTEVPQRTVLSIQVNTDVTDIIEINHGYHYYVGDDSSFFRYPDQGKLDVGNIFSDREYEILKCIASGLESHEIAEQLFLSIHTINTHRRNILIKTGKRSTHELVLDLKERGVI